jgi:hypothetical protein
MIKEQITWHRMDEKAPEDGEVVSVRISFNGSIAQYLFKDGRWFFFGGLRWISIPKVEESDFDFWARIRGPLAKHSKGGAR